MTELKKALAAGAGGGRAKKRAERKKRILYFITAKQRITTTGLLSIMQEMNRTTLCELMKELQTEGLIQRVGWQWQTEIGVIND
ncbi:MAG: hypothetical protein EAZ18_13045 [Oscillatoriales cyanobacterium]|nr:MAG: hypothetical protein EAZ18_13045 [Oscillatoriales cyanobacterium]